MNTKEIMEWLGYKQGKAAKGDIVKLWRAWPESGECIYVAPNSTFERVGLRVGNNYTIGTAFAEIGCEVNG